MEYIRLGRTGLMVTSPAFGALPIQRDSLETAVQLLQRAQDGGINFFDTANAYSDSEEKLGAAFHDRRDKIIIATKSGGKDYDTVLSHIELSLRRLRTDYIDVIQLHNPAALPDPEDPKSTYGAMKEAQKRGWVRFIGITNHGVERAAAAIRSDRYDTVQFPFNILSADKDLALAPLAKEHDVGFIAMKALAGGLLNNGAAAFAFMRQYDNVVPIWGVQKSEELEQFLALSAHPPVVDDAMRKIWADFRHELAGDFCHACGYCLPCPAGIDIPTTARMTLLLGRAVYQNFLNDRSREMMEKITQCKHCGLCKSRCPYGLDASRMNEDNLKFYRAFCEAHKDEWQDGTPAMK